MTIFSSLPPSEQARQLANPEGQIGLAVAEWLNGNNREATAQVLQELDVGPGCKVLEIGFGNGRTASEVINLAEHLRYVGIEISETMLDEAARYNAAHLSEGRVDLHLTSSECMPFPNESFDRVFSVGVIHFWADPIASLREVHRVMRSGSRAVMQAQDPRSTRPFARPAYGFYLRSAEEWGTLFREAGFKDVKAQSIESLQSTSDGTSTKRYSVRVIAER
jgi:ubiquinone/menaquinone biosynthesis C-methylase UbiE